MGVYGREHFSCGSKLFHFGKTQHLGFVYFQREACRKACHRPPLVFCRHFDLFLPHDPEHSAAHFFFTFGFDKVIICFLSKNSRTASSSWQKGRATDPKTLRISSKWMAYLLRYLCNYFQFCIIIVCLSLSVKDAELHLEGLSDPCGSRKYI